MKHFNISTILRPLAILVALSFVFSSLAMAKYIWEEEDTVFYVSHSVERTAAQGSARTDDTKTYTGLVPGYYAFFLRGGTGGDGSGNGSYNSYGNPKKGGAGGTVQGAFYVSSSGSTITVVAGGDGHRPLNTNGSDVNPGTLGGGNGSCQNNNNNVGGSGGSFSALALDGTVLAVAGGGGGAGGANCGGPGGAGGNVVGDGTDKVGNGTAGSNGYVWNIVDRWGYGGGAGTSSHGTGGTASNPIGSTGTQGGSGTNVTWSGMTLGRGGDAPSPNSSRGGSGGGGGGYRAGGAGGSFAPTGGNWAVGAGGGGSSWVSATVTGPNPGIPNTPSGSCAIIYYIGPVAPTVAPPAFSF